MGGRFGEALWGYVRRRAASHALAFLAFAAGVAAGAAAPAWIAEEGRAALLGEVRTLMERAGGGPPPPPEDVLRSALAEHVLKGPVLIGFFGLSVIGAPLVLAVVFARGFALGFAAALFVDGFFLRGVPLAVAALAPQALLAAPAVVAAGAAAVAFSAAAGRLLLGRREINTGHQFFATAAVLAASGAALVGAAFVEAYVSPVLLSAAVRLFLPR